MQIPSRTNQSTSRGMNLHTVCKFLPGLTNRPFVGGICVSYANSFLDQPIDQSWKEFAYSMQIPFRTNQSSSCGKNLCTVCKFFPRLTSSGRNLSTVRKFLPGSTSNGRNLCSVRKFLLGMTSCGRNFVYCTQIFSQTWY